MNNDEYRYKTKLEYVQTKREYDAVSAYLDARASYMDFNEFGKLRRVRAELADKISRLETILKPK